MATTASGRFVELDDDDEETSYQERRRHRSDPRSKQHRKKSHYDKVLKPQPKVVCNPDDAYFARQYLKQQEEARRRGRGDDERRRKTTKKKSRSRSRPRKTNNGIHRSPPTSQYAEDILGDSNDGRVLSSAARFGSTSTSTSGHIVHADTGTRPPNRDSPTNHSGRSHSRHRPSTTTTRTTTTTTTTQHSDPDPILVSPPDTDAEDSQGSGSSSSSGSSGSSACNSASSAASSSHTDDDDDDDDDDDTFDVDAYTTDGAETDALEYGDSEEEDDDDDDDDDDHSATSSPSAKQAKRNLKRLLQDDSSMTQFTIDRAILNATAIANLCKGISRNTSIVQLHLNFKGVSGKYGDDENTISLFQALEYNDTIGGLSLSHVTFDRFMAQALSMFLFQVPSLALLRLHHCTFRDKSAFAIVIMGIQHVRKTLQTLHLEGIPLGLSVNDTASSAQTAATDMDLVSTTLPFLLKLTTLTLKNVQLSLSGWKFFLNMLDKNATTTEQLDLSQNKILSTKEGIQALVDSNLLSGSSGGGGKNGEKDAKQTASPLKRLSLAECGLKRPAIKTLVQEGFLESATKSTLKHLELSGNVDIDDRCCRYLLQLLTKTPSISTLGLDQCTNISKKYMRELNDQLRYNNSFFKTFGISSDVSLAIMDGMQMLGDMAK